MTKDTCLSQDPELLRVFKSSPQKQHVRRSYDSGEVLRAAHGTGASTSNTCGFLTSTRKRDGGRGESTAAVA
jgi:hypothetical protein